MSASVLPPVRGGAGHVTPLAEAHRGTAALTLDDSVGAGVPGLRHILAAPSDVSCGG